MSLAATSNRLYYYPGNANLAPHILLEEAGCEYELVLVDRARQGQKNAEYLRLNPNGTIPTWVAGSLVVFEAAAICLHIADHYPEARLAPQIGSSVRASLYIARSEPLRAGRGHTRCDEARL